MNQPDNNPDAVKALYDPPSVLRIKFCPICGQDNLVRPLKDRHFSGGSLCKGMVIIVTYLRKDSDNDV